MLLFVVLALIARLELVLELCRRPGAGDDRRLARARGAGRPHLRLRLAEHRRLSLPHRGRLRPRLGRVPQQPAAARAQAGGILVAAQIYQPSLLISEFTGPLTVADPGRPPEFAANWKLAPVERARHCRRRPSGFRWCSTSRRRPLRRTAAGKTSLRAKHIELHGRMAEGSAADKPVIEAALRLDAGRGARLCIRRRRSRSMPRSSTPCCAA